MCEDHQLNEVAGRPGREGSHGWTIDEPSKTNHAEITLDLSAAAGPTAEERQGDDQEAHLLCCHTKGDTIRVGLKDGGFFFPFSPGCMGSLGKGLSMRGQEGRSGK